MQGCDAKKVPFKRGKLSMTTKGNPNFCRKLKVNLDSPCPNLIKNEKVVGAMLITIDLKIKSALSLSRK